MENIQKQLAQVMSVEQNSEENEKKIATVDFKMVTFSLSGKDYAIDIMSVKEIAKAGRFTYVPNTAPFVLGVYNLRGEIIPIIDLRLFFNIEVEERSDNQIENKTGEEAVEEVKAGRVEYRTDSFGNVHGIIGNTDFTEEKLVENMDAFMATLLKVKPATVKGEYVKNISIASTMGPGIKVSSNSFDK